MEHRFPMVHAFRPVLPNPGTDRVQVSYSLPMPSQIKLSVYDLAGQLVRTLASGNQPAGERKVTWNRLDGAGRKVASGVYFVRLEVDESVQTRKLVLK